MHNIFVLAVLLLLKLLLNNENMADRWARSRSKQQRSLPPSRYSSSHWAPRRTCRYTVVALLAVTFTVFILRRYAHTSESTSVLYRVRDTEVDFTGTLRTPAKTIEDLASHSDKTASGNKSNATMELKRLENFDVSKKWNIQQEEDKGKVSVQSNKVGTSGTSEVGKAGVGPSADNTSDLGHGKLTDNSTSTAHTLSTGDKGDTNSRIDGFRSTPVKGVNDSSEQGLSTGADLQKRDAVKKVSACMCRHAELNVE